MKLTLDALLTVASIVREGSINRAAEVLHRAPSTVWHTVKKLERDLGFQVLKRQGRGVVITPAGQELLDRGGLVLEMVGDLERSLEQIAQGWESTLRIAVADVVPNDWLFPLLAELQTQSAKTTLSISKEVLGGNWDALISRRADLVIGAPCAPPSGRGIEGFELGSIEFVYVVAPTHPLANVREPLTPEDVANHRVIIVPDTSRSLPTMPTRAISEQPVFRVPDFNAKIIAHINGIGVGYIIKHLAQDEINAGRLVHKVFIGDPYIEPVWIGWRAGSAGKAMQWILDRLRTIEASWLLDNQDSNKDI